MKKRNADIYIVDEEGFNPVKAFGIVLVAAIVILSMALCVTMVYSKCSNNADKDPVDAPEPKRYTGQIQEYKDFRYQYVFSETEDIMDRQPVGIKLVSYIGNNKKVSIPEVLDKFPVITIGNSCFSGSGIEKINIPLSIETIDSFAFYECENLKEVLFDENGTSKSLLIKDSAFRDCINIGTLCFPYLKLDIKSTAFMNCSSLKFLVFNDMCALKIGVGAFQGCALEKVKLPYRTRVIEDNAFKNCSIKHLDIPEDCEVGKNITLRDNNAYRVARSSSDNNKDTTKAGSKSTTKPKKEPTLRGFISGFISSETTTSVTSSTAVPDTASTTMSDDTTSDDTTTVSEPSTERQTTTRRYHFWPFF